MPQAPSVGASPVVLFEPNVVCRRVDAAHLEAPQVLLLDLVRRRLQDHLELVVFEQPVGILAESTVGRPPRGLHVGHLPGLRAQHSQKRLGVHRASPPTSMSRGWWIKQPMRGPEVREREDEILKRHDGEYSSWAVVCQRSASRSQRSAIGRATPTGPAERRPLGGVLAPPSPRGTLVDLSSFSKCVLISRRCTASSSRPARPDNSSAASRSGPAVAATPRNASASGDRSTPASGGPHCAQMKTP